MMRQSRLGTAIFCMAAMMLLTAANKGGCGEGLDNRAGEKGIDVGGIDGATWAVSYGQTMEVIIKRGGVVAGTKNIVVGAGGSIDLDGIAIDLDSYCQRDDVVCPYDVFPNQVVMKQPGSELHLLFVDFNPVGPLARANKVRLLGNVDSDDDFSIALGIGGATNGVCGLLGVSYATGHIDASPTNAELGASLEGEIVTAYSGGCLVLGKAAGAAAGLTVEFRIPFSATRL